MRYNVSYMFLSMQEIGWFKSQDYSGFWVKLNYNDAFSSVVSSMKQGFYNAKKIMYQLYICFDAFAPLPEQYNNIQVSFYFWLMDEDPKSYFNVSTLQAWDRKDRNKLWLSTPIISFLPFELTLPLVKPNEGIIILFSVGSNIDSGKEKVKIAIIVVPVSFLALLNPLVHALFSRVVGTCERILLAQSKNMWVQVLRMGKKTLPPPFSNLFTLDGDDTLQLTWDRALIPNNFWCSSNWSVGRFTIVSRSDIWFPV